MTELKYDDNGAPIRKFPITMVRGERTHSVDTESGLIAAEWDGFVQQDQEKALAKAVAAGDKARASE